jgi:hypothetical protein
MKPILKAAFASDELAYQLQEIICHDDQCELEDITDALIISEARHVLDKYTGGIGFVHEEEYNGEHGPEAQAEAVRNVKAIKRFLKKYH